MQHLHRISGSRWCTLTVIGSLLLRWTLSCCSWHFLFCISQAVFYNNFLLHFITLHLKVVHLLITAQYFRSQTPVTCYHLDKLDETQSSMLLFCKTFLCVCVCVSAREVWHAPCVESKIECQQGTCACSTKMHKSNGRAFSIAQVWWPHLFIWTKHFVLTHVRLCDRDPFQVFKGAMPQLFP